MHRGQIFENWNDAETGFISFTPQDQKELQAVSVPLEPGDVLCFTQKAPHRALPNKTDRVRWSMDLRFESTPRATETGKKQGLIARSAKNPQSVTSYADWLSKWRDIPAVSY